MGKIINPQRRKTYSKMKSTTGLVLVVLVMMVQVQLSEQFFFNFLCPFHRGTCVNVCKMEKKCEAVCTVRSFWKVCKFKCEDLNKDCEKEEEATTAAPEAP